MEKRNFHRVRYAARCTLTHNGITYHGRTENISLNGALISFTDGIIVPKGDECAVLVFLEDQDVPLKLTVEVVYSFYTMVGTRFKAVDLDATGRLFALIETVTGEPDKLKEELERIKGYVAEYLGQP
jgi:hypothetical protein